MRPYQLIKFIVSLFAYFLVLGKLGIIWESDLNNIFGRYSVFRSFVFSLDKLKKMSKFLFPIFNRKWSNLKGKGTNKKLFILEVFFFFTFRANLTPKKKNHDHDRSQIESHSNIKKTVSLDL
jgi:hypothetical protein